MVIFNPTRKLKSSDGFMVLFQLFLILEVGYFLSRTVNRLIIFIPWLRWLRSATYHYVDNGFLRQTSLKWSKVDLNDSVPWKSSSPLQASFKVCYASLTCPKRGCVGQRLSKTFKPISREDSTWSVFANVDIDNGYYNKCSITFKTFYNR